MISFLSECYQQVSFWENQFPSTENHGLSDSEHPRESKDDGLPKKNLR